MPFVPNYSTNEIWRDDDTTRCLTDDLDTIEFDIQTLDASKADAGHTHAQADVTGLASALAGKASSTHTHTAADVGAATATHNHDADYADISHTHTGYAAASHSHTPASIGAAASSHAHAIADVSGLATALSGKAATDHIHSNYAASNHTHSGYATVDHTHTGYASSSHTHTPASIGAAASNHNHNTAYINKTLQPTTDTGNAELQIPTNSTLNLLTEIEDMGMGFHTFYSASGNAGNPKPNEAWRGVVFKTGPAYGFVQAYGSLGSVYSNYQDGTNGGWRGWMAIYDATPAKLWGGLRYPRETAADTITPTKKLSECRNGWVLIWSDYNADQPGTSQNCDFVTTVIPKRNPYEENWNGEGFFCDIPSYIGSDTSDITTEIRLIKRLKIYDDKIMGYAENALGGRTDVVLRAVYEY